jgi:sorting nexin-1/2
MLESIGPDEDNEATSTGPRVPPPVQPSPGAPIRRDTQPSVSVEQAAKPTFEITVGDPHKVGDLTSSHIVYLVRTKVMFLSRVMGRFSHILDFIKSIQDPRV